MIWGQILDSYDRGQPVTLDSDLNLSPKLMVISQNKTPNDRLNSGPNLASVQRMKFNQTPQSIDNDLYLQTIIGIEDNLNDKSNIAHETITVIYNNAPTTIAELNALEQV